MNSPLAIPAPRRALRAFVMSLIMLGGLLAPAFAASPEQAPPIPAGQSRVWFVRQLLPGTIFTPPMVYVNGAAIARSAEGTAFYRDLTPGQYRFTVENCLTQSNTGQTMTLKPNAQYAIEVQQDDNPAWDCSPAQVSYLRQVQPNDAAYIFAPLTYLGSM